MILQPGIFSHCQRFGDTSRGLQWHSGGNRIGIDTEITWWPVWIRMQKDGPRHRDRAVRGDQESRGVQI